MRLPSLPIAALFAAAVPLAWLLPNHYYPWLSAWQEGLALFLLCAAAIACRRGASLPALWVAAVALALGSIALQWATGRIHFGGDALMAAAYLASFVLAIALGASFATNNAADSGVATASEPTAHSHALGFVDMWALGVLVGATLSTAVALVQWTGAVSLGLFGVDMPPGGRPYANVAQPNHFSTIAFLGVCALALLRERGRIGPAGLFTGAAFLLCGMVMSGSRTGWMQMAFLVVALAWFGRRITLRTGVRAGLAFAAIFIALTLTWRSLADWVELSPTRASSEQLEAGTRLAHWQTLLDAITRKPWTGYGWQQVAAAQQAAALDHPPVGEHIEHSHNIVLDLLLWAGVPVGGLIVLLVAAALVRQWRAVRDPRAAWLLIAVGGIFVHGLLEYPLEYAYFLIPMGLALGAAHALSGDSAGRPWPRLALPIGGGALVLVLVVVAIDYLKAEENHRILRLETARIGVSKLETPAPDLMVLDQLQAFLEFARTEARPGMAPEEVEQMRRVSERFAYPPAMFRFALAAGLNGQPEVASDTLGRLCRIHPAPRCDEGREAWAGLQQRYPQLSGIAYP
jgi:hypothetical protein